MQGGFPMMNRKIPRILCPAAALLLLCLGVVLWAVWRDGNPSPAPLPPSDRTSPASDTALPHDPETDVVIRTAEDLMAFNRAVNMDEYDFAGVTVVFRNDIDMTGYTWTPLDGARLKGATFDGQGHTVRNLTLADYEYPLDAQPDNADKGCGLVDVAEGDLLFRNLTLANTRVKAYDLSVGNFLGGIRAGFVRFENCRSVSFTAEGWMDWLNRNPADGGHSIAMRMGGFVGTVGPSGQVSFAGCTAEGLTLYGFHNLAGFVGYDESGQLEASAFSDCRVSNARITFSYGLSEAFAANPDDTFVSVFFNDRDHQNHTAPCLAAGNSFENVVFYDWADDCTAYTPENFHAKGNRSYGHIPG
jgi:hypothetical protein